MKTLKEVKIGETCKVVRLHGEGAVKRRIMDMGIKQGTPDGLVLDLLAYFPPCRT